jgi:hypothetical protein
VAEDSQTQYSAIALYDNNSTRDVTTSATWSVAPNTLASIDENGLLTTPPIYYLTEDITIYAQYTQASNTVDAEKPVSIFAVCPTGTALEFDKSGGGDEVDCGNDVSISGLSTFSISLWFKTDVVPASGAHPHLIGQQESSDRVWTLILHGDYSGRLTGRIETSGTAAVGRSNFIPETGRWYHAAITYDDGGDRTVRVYVDGEEQSYMYQTAGTGTMLADSSLKVAIGNRIGGGKGWDGVIDDVAIFNGALSAEQIQTLMHTKLTGSEEGLVACWDFDEGEGQIVYDLSPNANHGQLGSDPNADDSDPAWVDSDAPTGICTAGELIERHVTDALQIKQDILAGLDVAVTKEDAALYILQDLFLTRDTSSLTKRQILMLRQLIHKALQKQQSTEATLEDSIEILEDASAVLDGNNNVNAIKNAKTLRGGKRK